MVDAEGQNLTPDISKRLEEVSDYQACIDLLNQNYPKEDISSREKNKLWIVSRLLSNDATPVIHTQTFTMEYESDDTRGTREDYVTQYYLGVQENLPNGEMGNKIIYRKETIPSEVVTELKQAGLIYDPNIDNDSTPYKSGEWDLTTRFYLMELLQQKFLKDEIFDNATQRYGSSPDEFAIEKKAWKLFGELDKDKLMEEMVKERELVAPKLSELKTKMEEEINSIDRTRDPHERASVRKHQLELSLQNFNVDNTSGEELKDKRYIEMKNQQTSLEEYIESEWQKESNEFAHPPIETGKVVHADIQVVEGENGAEYIVVFKDVESTKVVEKKEKGWFTPRVYAYDKQKSQYSLITIGEESTSVASGKLYVEDGERLSDGNYPIKVVPYKGNQFYFKVLNKEEREKLENAGKEANNDPIRQFAKRIPENRMTWPGFGYSKPVVYAVPTNSEGDPCNPDTDQVENWVLFMEEEIADTGVKKLTSYKGPRSKSSGKTFAELLNDFTRK